MKPLTYDSDSGSSLAINSSWYIYRRPIGRQDMNRLYHVVTENLRNIKIKVMKPLTVIQRLTLVILIYLAVLATP